MIFFYKNHTLTNKIESLHNYENSIILKTFYLYPISFLEEKKSFSSLGCMQFFQNLWSLHQCTAIRRKPFHPMGRLRAHNWQVFSHARMKKNIFFFLTFRRYFREDPNWVEPSEQVQHRYRSMSGTRGTNFASDAASGVAGKFNGAEFPLPHRPRPRATIDNCQGEPPPPPRTTSKIKQQPKLTIIDFNQLTRGGLELATGKNRLEVLVRRPITKPPKNFL